MLFVYCFTECQQSKESLTLAKTSYNFEHFVGRLDSDNWN